MLAMNIYQKIKKKYFWKGLYLTYFAKRTIETFQQKLGQTSDEYQ